MVLTGGQTYFLFFCTAVVAVSLITNVSNIIRVHKMTSPCKELQRVKEEVALLRAAVRRISQNARRSA